MYIVWSLMALVGLCFVLATLERPPEFLGQLYRKRREARATKPRPRHVADGNRRRAAGGTTPRQAPVTEASAHRQLTSASADRLAPETASV
jgi:hypothetical protein